MKKVLQTTALALLCLHGYAQNPQQRNMALVQKSTATWCYPCGNWGWEIFEGILEDNRNKAVMMSLYSSGTSDLYNVHAKEFADSFAPNAGWPAFCANGYNRIALDGQGNIQAAETRTKIKQVVDSFVQTPVVASTAYNYTITGNTLSVHTATKFWSDNVGDYYVNVYIVEDSVMNQQAAQNGIVPHHYVLRAGVDGTWGQNLLNGIVSAGHTVIRGFTYTLPTDWNKKNLHVVTAIFKKDANRYHFINANNVSGNTTGIHTISIAGNVRMFPNPSAGRVNLAVDVDNASDISYNITDVTGRTVFSKQLDNVAYGVHSEQISTADWANGTYLVNITLGTRQYTGKLVVAH